MKLRYKLCQKFGHKKYEYFVTNFQGREHNFRVCTLCHQMQEYMSIPGTPGKPSFFVWMNMVWRTQKGATEWAKESNIEL